MNQIVPVRPFAPHGRTAGWLFSFALHGCMLLASMSAFSKLSIVTTDTERFQWDVSMVEAPHQQALAEPADTHAERSKAAPSQFKATPPAPVQTAQPSLTPVTRHVETNPVVEPVERESREVVNMVQPARQVVKVEMNPVIPQTTLEQAKVVKEVAPVETVMGTKSVMEQSYVTTDAVVKHEEVVSEKITESAVVAKVETSVVHRPVVQESASSTVAHTEAQVETEITSHVASEEQPVAHADVHSNSSEPKQAASPTRETNAQVVLAPRNGPATKADYGWLAESLWKKVAELKRYPHEARLNRWEGKVVLKAVIKENGHLGAISIKESSGFEILDQDALELVRQACPIHLKYPLGRSEVAIQIPINYALR